MKTYSKLFILTVLITVVFSSNAQEYDDMYFSKKDRKKVKPVEKNLAPAVSEKTSSFLSRQIAQNNELTEEYSENEVSQEAIDKYRKQDSNGANEPVEVLENSNYSNPADTYYEDEYYEEEPVIVNNYYYDDPWRYNNNWRGFRNPWRFRPGFSVSVGWGFGWGAFGGGWGYDPFWDPYYSGFGWGWNNPWYGGFNSFYGPPYYRNSFARGYGRFDGYNGRYYGTPSIGRASTRRAITRGPRNSRGGAVSSSGRSANVRNVSAASSTNDSRDYSSTQARYLEKSRRGTRVSNSNGRTSTATRSANRAASDGINRSNSSRYSKPSNSSRQRSYTPSSGRSSNAGRSGSGTVRSSSSSRSSSGSVRSSSSSRNRSGGVRSSSSSRGGSSSARPSSSSRSRSSSGVRSSSPSRSSGSVRSSGSSRSSSGRSSSGSRSSSSRSSSSRSRGN
ncbi:MAG: hypothetical protein ABJP45_16310 [Cyclobacteriaceae bacterium]